MGGRKGFSLERLCHPGGTFQGVRQSRKDQDGGTDVPNLSEPWRRGLAKEPEGRLGKWGGSLGSPWPTWLGLGRAALAVSQD